MHRRIRTLIHSVFLIAAAANAIAQAPGSAPRAQQAPGARSVTRPAATDDTSAEASQIDSTKPQTASDSRASGPETAHDDPRLTVSSARESQANAPETARDDERLRIATASDSTRNVPDTARDDDKTGPEDATDPLRKVDAKKLAVLRQAQSSTDSSASSSAPQQR